MHASQEPSPSPGINEWPPLLQKMIPVLYNGPQALQPVYILPFIKRGPGYISRFEEKFASIREPVSERRTKGQLRFSK